MTDHSLNIVGVALEGPGGSPVIVLESPNTGRFLPLEVDPFDAETLIRDFLDDDYPEDPADHTSIAWLAELLRRSPPRLARIETSADGSPVVRLQAGVLPSLKDRFLSPGEGLVLCRKLELPVHVSEGLYETTREHLRWMSSNGTFTGDFLYLSPPQYAPGIPVE